MTASARLVLLFAGLVLPLAPKAEAGQTIGVGMWSHVPATQADGGLGDLLVDLDGDGRNEVLRIVHGRNSDPGLVAMEFQPDGSLAVVGLATGNWSRVLDVAVVRHGDRPDTLLASVRQSAFQLILVELEGKGLRQMRTISLPTGFRVTTVEDIDADGDLEMVGIGAELGHGPVHIADYATGVIKRTLPIWAGTAVAAQLDADAALELILADNAGGPGRVVDGSTGDEEWLFAPGFPHGVRTGRFSPDAATSTFIAPGADGTRIFSAAPYGVLREFPLNTLMGRAAVLDVDGDGIEEVFAQFPLPDPGLYWIDAISGVPTKYGASRSFELPANVGRLFEGGPAVALITQEMGSRRGGFRVVDIASGVDLHEQVNETGPHTSAAFFDPAGDGGVRVALVNVRNGIDLKRGRVSVLDGKSGRILAQTTIDPGLGDPFSFPGLAVGDFDGLPGEDIVVTGVGASTVMLDGETLAQRWRRDDPSPMRPLRSSAAADVNGDSRDEIIQIYVSVETGSPYRTGVRALLGTTGAVLWDTGLILDGTVDRDLRVGEFDGLPGLEVLVGGTKVRAFDAATGAAKWEIEPVNTSLSMNRLAAWGSGPHCRIGLLLGSTHVGSNRMQTFRCSDRGLDGFHGLPELTQSVESLDDEGTAWVMHASGMVWLGGPGLLSTAVSDSMETSLTMATPGRAFHKGPDYVDLLMGSSLRLLRYRIADDALFADSFESP